MSNNRRHFLKLSGIGVSWLGGSACGALNAGHNKSKKPSTETKIESPVVVSTWSLGRPANDAAWNILKSQGAALDAVEAGARIPEADPNERSVGRGGRPDQRGVVTLDACIMNQAGDCGSVAFVQGFAHPVSIARAVMEKTPHVMLVGEGAQGFALEQGFTRSQLLTPPSEREWKKWLEEQATQAHVPADAPKAEINVENHDTIGILALDSRGDLSGACTTSGAAYKLHGRVGDSPIIGAGLFVDNQVGAACATGWGEAVIRTCGSHLVVEMMRQGHSPTEACRIAVERVVEKNPDYQSIQVGFLALNKKGEHGGFAIQKGFEYALRSQSIQDRMVSADAFHLKSE